MKAYKMMERQIPNLTEQDCKKLFPKEYYTKYAAHLKILQFQKSLLEQLDSAKPKQLFIQRKKSLPIFNTQRTPIKTKTKLNKNDFVNDTISNNKQQVQRMSLFVKNLNHKLQQGPSKSAKTIRTPLAGFEAVSQQVFEKMRFIQNDQYSIVLNKLQQKKKKQYQYMNFKPRSRYHSISAQKFQARMNKSIIADSAQSQSIKELNLLHPHQTVKKQEAIITKDNFKHGSKSISYSEKMQQLMKKARSQIITINPEDRHSDVKLIMALNNSIKKINNLKQDLINQRRRFVTPFSGNKYGQKAIKNVNKSQWQQKKRRKNLIEMTGNVRKQGQSIEMLRRLDNLMTERRIKQLLKNK